MFSFQTVAGVVRSILSHVLFFTNLTHSFSSSWINDLGVSMFFFGTLLRSDGGATEVVVGDVPVGVVGMPSVVDLIDSSVF